jgi:SOS-response transcriptional repressor LexA
MMGCDPVVDLQPQFTTYNHEDQPLFASPSTTSFCTIRGMESLHIGKRIKEVRSAARDPGGREISQSDLARAVGTTPQAVQKWEAGLSAPRNNRLNKIAHVLNTTVRELVRGTNLEGIAESSGQKDVGRSKVSPQRDAKIGVSQTKHSRIPLISWERAVSWGTTLENFDAVDAEDWMFCPFDHGPAAFILEIAGESNFDPTGPKSYAPGEFIAVDPAREPTNRSMVVIRADHEERATLKQLLMDEGNTKLLKSLNPSWPTRVLPMPEGSKIIGVVIGKWVPE